MAVLGMQVLWWRMHGHGRAHSCAEITWAHVALQAGILKDAGCKTICGQSATDYAQSATGPGHHCQ